MLISHNTGVECLRSDSCLLMECSNANKTVQSDDSIIQYKTKLSAVSLSLFGECICSDNQAMQRLDQVK